MLADVAGRFAERAAIVENGNSISYQQLQQFSRQVARALMTLGVQAGDRVALWAPNLSEWIVAACGVHAAGAVLVPLNTRMKGPRLLTFWSAAAPRCWSAWATSSTTTTPTC